jgi:hypothetical protein
MAKKSSAGRSRPTHTQGQGIARKPNTPERGNAATLVRPSNAPTPSASNVVAEPTPAAAPATPAAAPAAKPAAAAQRPASVSTREQNVRMARARATQRARSQNLIAAENYAYVLGDLKLVLALAIAALIVLIALTFVLPH